MNTLSQFRKFELNKEQQKQILGGKAAITCNIDGTVWEMKTTDLQTATEQCVAMSNIGCGGCAQVIES